MKTPALPQDIRRAISRFEKEVRNHAFKGTAHPSEYEEIEIAYLQAKDGLIRVINRHLKEEVK